MDDNLEKLSTQLGGKLNQVVQDLDQKVSQRLSQDFWSNRTILERSPLLAKMSRRQREVWLVCEGGVLLSSIHTLRTIPELTALWGVLKWCTGAHVPRSPSISHILVLYCASLYKWDLFVPAPILYSLKIRCKFLLFLCTRTCYDYKVNPSRTHVSVSWYLGTMEKTKKCGLQEPTTLTVSFASCEAPPGNTPLERPSLFHQSNPAPRPETQQVKASEPQEPTDDATYPPGMWRSKTS